MRYAMHYAHCHLFTAPVCSSDRPTNCSTMNPTFHRTLGLLALAGLILLGVGLSAAAPEADAVVMMTNDLKFTPATVTIQRGQTVEWRNTSLLVHTVTADPAKATLAESVRLPDGAPAFDSGTLDPEATFRHTFTVPGTYRYFCVPHEGAKMRGTVIVE